MTSCKMR